MRFATGEKPQMANSSTLATVSFRPSCAKRVSSRSNPTTPTPIKRLDGSSMMPSVLDRKKNTARSPHFPEHQLPDSAVIASNGACIRAKSGNSTRGGLDPPLKPPIKMGRKGPDQRSPWPEMLDLDN